MDENMKNGGGKSVKGGGNRRKSVKGRGKQIFSHNLHLLQILATSATSATSAFSTYPLKEYVAVSINICP